jgi:PKD repeat protein
LTFAWDLNNDGVYDDAFVVNPVFSAVTRDDGVYPVGVRASDGVYTDAGRTTVSVLNVAPSVWLTATATDVTIGAPITFTGSFVDPGVLDTHTTRWRFGDGTPDLFGLLARAHTFGAAGAYTVSLTVTDDNGGAGTASYSLRVLPPVSTPSTVFLPLITKNLCLATPVYADIALVMDTSGSMDEPAWAGGPTKLQLAKSAATDFLNLLVFPGDQAAIVSFDSDATLDHVLSDDRAGLIAALNSLAAGGVTRMDLGLAVARGELLGPRHIPSSGRNVLFLTDGQPNGATEEAVLAEAASAKAQGITLYTIGLGSGVDHGLLRAMASSPDHYYYSPSSAQLSEIYRRIAGELRCRP